jgi:hypothetical protein
MAAIGLSNPETNVTTPAHMIGRASSRVVNTKRDRQEGLDGGFSTVPRACNSYEDLELPIDCPTVGGILFCETSGCSEPKGLLNWVAMLGRLGADA